MRVWSRAPVAAVVHSVAHIKIYCFFGPQKKKHQTNRLEFLIQLMTSSAFLGRIATTAACVWRTYSASTTTEYSDQHRSSSTIGGLIHLVFRGVCFFLARRRLVFFFFCFPHHKHFGFCCVCVEKDKQHFRLDLNSKIFINIDDPS